MPKTDGTGPVRRRPGGRAGPVRVVRGRGAGRAEGGRGGGGRAERPPG
ncbi:hypothetical protein [Streptomyces sp. NPDC004014]